MRLVVTVWVKDYVQKVEAADSDQLTSSLGKPEQVPSSLCTACLSSQPRGWRKSREKGGLSSCPSSSDLRVVTWQWMQALLPMSMTKVLGGGSHWGSEDRR